MSGRSKIDFLLKKIKIKWWLLVLISALAAALIMMLEILLIK